MCSDECIPGTHTFPACAVREGMARMLPEQVNKLRDAAEYRRAEPLAELLREAEAAHLAYKLRYKHGRSDADWATWYASWLTGRLS